MCYTLHLYTCLVFYSLAEVVKYMHYRQALVKFRKTIQLANDKKRFIGTRLQAVIIMTIPSILYKHKLMKLCAHLLKCVAVSLF